MWKHGMIATIAAAALVVGAPAAQADLVHHHQDGAHEIQEHAPTGTEAAAFGHGR